MPKRFTVREAMPDGDIKSASEFQEYLTLEDARERARYLAKSMAEMNELRESVA